MSGERGCGVCGVAATEEVLVTDDGYTVPRCVSHLESPPYQAEARLLTSAEAQELLGALKCLLRVTAVLNLNLPDLLQAPSPAGKNLVDALNDIAASTPSVEDGLTGYLAYPGLLRASRPSGEGGADG